ncbi:hypothetical protein GCM10008910_13250 [Faecalicatena orotica]|uniref:DUF2975 family protein n=1 Tax=Faecalicatena orotica TaxID=1544 RepID=A0A2Y9BAN0_9FIRM|nr:hypothetical protein [Faecalicatena orotica]PWJ31369.1 hypothetical protein A8806_102225 [Faecalicatena orotica]SSA54575.1 hypothetical protein SAMN05216536_102225 [Faecalicatena orotica]
MNQKRLKQTGSTLAKITRVLFWIQFLEMVIAAFLVCWHEFFPSHFVLHFVSEELLFQLCVSLVTGGFILGVLARFRKLCGSLSQNGDPFHATNAAILKSISITVLAASFVLPAAEKVFVEAFHLSGCNTDAASLSVLIMLTAALLFFLSVLLKSGAERFHDASLYK